MAEGTLTTFLRKAVAKAEPYLPQVPKPKKKLSLQKRLLWCGGIALFASITLGNPTCEQQADPVYGGCEYYADDGYEPTTEQRAANFAYFMTLLYIPVVFGAFSGNKLTSDKI